MSDLPDILHDIKKSVDIPGTRAKIDQHLDEYMLQLEDPITILRDGISSEIVYRWLMHYWFLTVKDTPQKTASKSSCLYYPYAERLRVGLLWALADKFPMTVLHPLLNQTEPCIFSPNLMMHMTSSLANRSMTFIEQLTVLSIITSMGPVRYTHISQNDTFSQLVASNVNILYPKSKHSAGHTAFTDSFKVSDRIQVMSKHPPSILPKSGTMKNWCEEFLQRYRLMWIGLSTLYMFNSGHIQFTSPDVSVP